MTTVVNRKQERFALRATPSQASAIRDAARETEPVTAFVSACTAIPDGRPPSLAPHVSFWRSSTSSSLHFRDARLTHCWRGGGSARGLLTMALAATLMLGTRATTVSAVGQPVMVVVAAAATATTAPPPPPPPQFPPTPTSSAPTTRQPYTSTSSATVAAMPTPDQTPTPTSSPAPVALGPLPPGPTAPASPRGAAFPRWLVVLLGISAIVIAVLGTVLYRVRRTV